MYTYTYIKRFYCTLTNNNSKKISNSFFQVRIYIFLNDITFFLIFTTLDFFPIITEKF